MLRLVEQDRKSLGTLGPTHQPQMVHTLAAIAEGNTLLPYLSHCYFGIFYSHQNCILTMYFFFFNHLGFPGGEVAKDAKDKRDAGSIPGMEKHPGIGNGNSLQYSCLQNHMDRRAWQVTVHESL